MARTAGTKSQAGAKNSKANDVDDEWEEVDVAQDSSPWEWIEWERGEELVGYWIGSIIVGQGKKAWRIGLLAKPNHEEFSGNDEDDAKVYAFSLPIVLAHKMESIEEEYGYGYMVKIKCLGKVKNKSGTRSWDFSVLINKKKVLDEDTIKELQAGRKIVPIIENVTGKDQYKDEDDDEFED